MDQYDEQAERLLTQFPDSWSPSCRQVCDAAAAALREQGQETSRLREKCNLKDDEYTQQVAFSEKIIADLRAENAQLKAQLAAWEELHGVKP